MAHPDLVRILEGALLAAGKPLTVARLADVFEEPARPDNEAIREALSQIAGRCEDRGFELVEVASGFRFQVRQELSPWVGRLWQERPQKYSRALLETLALIAYRQPITRGEIEEIRGVAVSSNIIKTLHEREWVRVVGHRDVPGRPAMYATTRQFLDYFNLKSLDQLPALAEIRDLETLNAELGFSQPVTAEQTGPAAGGPGEPSRTPHGLTVVGGRDFAPETVADAGTVDTNDETAAGETSGGARPADSAPPVSLAELSAAGSAAVDGASADSEPTGEAAPGEPENVATDADGLPESRPEGR